MVLTYHNFPEIKSYEINRYFHHKLARDKNLITTSHGAWVVLSDEEFNLLRFGKLAEDPNLFNILEEKSIILTRDNDGKLEKFYQDKFAHLFNGVSLHIIAPTLRCNHSCIYCHAKSKPLDAKGFDMDTDTAKAVVDFIFQTPAKNIDIEFQGGEPLANFPVVQFIIDYSKKLNEKHKKDVRYRLVTNLTLMEEDMLKYLIENKVNICTSFDGPKEVHDKNRLYIDGKGSSYDNVVHQINDLKYQFGCYIHAIPTITRFSLPYGKKIIDEYIRLGFDRIRIRTINNAGLANERWEKIGYTADEFLKFWKDVLEYCLELNKKGKYFIEGMSVLIARKILSKDYQAYTCLSAPCGAALSQVGYDHNGDVYACDESRSFEIFKLGNVKENTYKEIYTSSSASALIALSSRAASLCDACVWHPYCGPCLVSTYGSQRNLVSKLPLDTECQIRKGMIEHIFRKLIFSKEDRKILLKWMSTEKGV